MPVDLLETSQVQYHVFTDTAMIKSTEPESDQSCRMSGNEQVLTRTYTFSGLAIPATTNCRQHGFPIVIHAEDTNAAPKVIFQRDIALNGWSSRILAKRHTLQLKNTALKANRHSVLLCSLLALRNNANEIICAWHTQKDIMAYYNMIFLRQFSIATNHLL